ncbi:MAG: hypothetical protein HDS25_01075 [Bacteroides sp.]|nr:hypothetical protein [Bacteroides sp.]
MASQIDTDTLIGMIMSADGRNVVTPDMIATVLDRLNTGMKSSAGDLSALLDGERIKKSSLPSDILYTGDLESELISSRGRIVSLILQALWAGVVSSSVAWPEIDPLRSGENLRVNGYYPAENVKPCYCCGEWLSEAEAWKVLLDRYTPFMGGVQCSSPVNLPVGVKSSDSSLTLDYACVNNSLPHAIVLGANGWSDSVRPTSMKRAFHNCQSLRAIIGEIDMTSISSAWAMNNFLAQCPKLWQFHLANIPDAIETLDLRGVADDCSTEFQYGPTASTRISSIGYLANNFDRDIVRTKPLTVVVSSNVFETIQREGLTGMSNLTWATA